MIDSLGIYLSVPFCKAKCSFCNFASGVFAADRMDVYVDRLCAEIRGARAMAQKQEAMLPERVDTVYLGGGTPSLLEPGHMRQLFAALGGEFRLDGDAEVTMEAAPGQIAAETLEAGMGCGVNRVSLGVQSFADRESAAVGRLHTGAECRAEIARLFGAGVERVNLDLIAGLPYQTGESWAQSVAEAIGTGVDHASVYMLEMDEDSRLGREAIAGGKRYHAEALPPEDAMADWYLSACAALQAAGLEQYEISNFARPGCASQHNLKYWRREPYLGFGLDAHSMLRCDSLPQSSPEGEPAVAMRWANPDDMDAYGRMLDGMRDGERDGRTGPGLRVLNGPLTQVGASGPEVDRIGLAEAFEESFFLGLRLAEGIDLGRIGREFGHARLNEALPALGEAEAAGLVGRRDSRVWLTARGRLASNEVFSRLLVA